MQGTTENDASLVVAPLSHGAGVHALPQIARGAPHILERTFGQWRKLAFKIKAPQAVDGRLNLSIRNFSGLMEIDGIMVRPVNDRQNDSLISFLEGTEMP